MKRLFSNDAFAIMHFFILMYFTISTSIYLVLSNEYMDLEVVRAINMKNIISVAIIAFTVIIRKTQRSSTVILFVLLTINLIITALFNVVVTHYSLNSVLDLFLNIVFWTVLSGRKTIKYIVIGSFIGLVCGLLFPLFVIEDDIVKYNLLLSNQWYGLSSIFTNILLVIIIIYHRYITFIIKIESMSKFSNIIAYEIFVPLAVIETSISALASIQDSKDKHLEVLQILKICRNTREKINFIMNNIRIINDTYVSKTSKISVSKVINECIAECEKSYRSISFKMHNDIIFTGSASVLKCAILNLIHNAFQHGGKDVQLDIIMSANCLIIQDNGYGIKYKEINDIFEYFSSSAKDHLGIGLAISRDIIQSFGGEMKCISLPGFHTTFVIKFPV